MADAPQPGVPAPPTGRKSILGVIFLTLFIDLVGFSIIFPLFPAMLEFYLEREQAAGGAGPVSALIAFLDNWTGGGDNFFFVTVLFGGVLGSLYSLLQFLFAPLWGGLSDRFGRRRILLLTVGGTALSYLLWIYSAAFELLILARLLGGMMAGNLSVATAAVADTTGRNKRSSGMAIVGVAFGLGFILGPALGGVASQWQLQPQPPAGDPQAWALHPFSAPALIAAVLAVVNWVWIALRFPETLPPEKRKSAEEARKTPRLALLGDSPVMRAVRINFLLILAFSGMEFTLTFLAVERFSYSPVQNGLMFVFIGVVLALVQGGLVRRLAPKIGEFPLIRGGFAIGLLAFLLLAFAGKSVLLFYLGLAAMAACIGMASPTLQGLVSLYVDERSQGKYLGIQRSAGAFARAIGPFAAAALYFSLGSRLTYALGAVIIVIPLVLAFRLPAPQRGEAG